MFFTVPPSRTLQTMASRKITGQTGSKGRACQSWTSSRTASVILEIRSGETSIS